MDGTFFEAPILWHDERKQTHPVFRTPLIDDNAIPLQTHFAPELHILLGMGGQHWGRVDGENAVQLIW